MNRDRPSALDLVAVLRARLNARAAGWWRLAEDTLELVAFAPADDMPETVAEGFAQATASVPLAATGLGIVRAVLSGGPAVSRIDELSADGGSGFWLRRFGAVRTIAVPARDAAGTIVRVVSVALADDQPVDQAVATLIRVAAETWAE